MSMPIEPRSGPRRLPGRILLLFLDGIGIGPDDRLANPFAAAHMPRLTSLLGGRRLVASDLGDPGSMAGTAAAVIAADATLGVAGRPQSGTGQSALLTGKNAPAIFGRHFGSWVPTPLRDTLKLHNVLSRSAAAGRVVAFANANPPGVRLDRRPSGPSIAAHAAAVLWRGPDELRQGRAVASSLTHERWIARFPDARIERITPMTAGQNLARISAGADLTLFAHYDTDFVGHRGSLADGVAILARVDEFLEGLMDRLPSDALLVIASDHGNLEDVRTGHTVNPVPVAASGPGDRELVEGVRSIMDVAPRLLALLSVE